MMSDGAKEALRQHCCQAENYTSSSKFIFQRQRLLISIQRRSSESRNGENPTYGLTRGLKEDSHGSLTEAYWEISR